MTGRRGPVPKRADQRLGHRKKDDPAAPQRTAAGARAVWPVPEAGWHPMAVEWYLSLARSGQAVFYEPSDAAMARIAGEVLTRLLSADRTSAQLLSAWLQLATSLLATEGDRRRLRLELERAKATDLDADAADATVTSLLGRLGGTSSPGA